MQDRQPSVQEREQPTSKPLDASRERADRWTLVGLALPMLLSSLGTSIANVALPTLARELEASFQAVQWVVLAYLLAIATTIVGVGRLADLVGRGRLLRLGILLFTLASAVSGIASALWLVIVARAAQGLGAAIMMALSVALVSEALPKARTGSAMGLLGTASALGTALGPSLGGVLVDHLGWQSIFLVNVPLGALSLLVAARHLPSERPSAARPAAGFDVAGALLLALTLAAYALAMTLGRGHFGMLNVALLLAAALTAGLFLLAEGRASSPLIRLTMFRDRALSASLAANLIVSSVLMTTLVVGPFYLSLSLGLEPETVGMILSVGPIVAAATGVPAGWLVDRFGAQRMMLVGLIGVATGAAALALLPETLGVPGYVVPVAVLTTHYALFSAANNTAVMKDVRSEQRGVVSGMLSLSRNLGLITGAALMGAVFSLASGTSDLTAAPPHAVATGMRVTFMVAAALVAVTLAIVLGAHRRALLAAALALGLLLVPGLSSLAAAQAHAPSASTSSAQPAPAARDDAGLVVQSADGASSLRLVGLAQLAYTHAWPADGQGSGTFLVNRARLGLTGSVLTRDLRYLLVAELGRGEPQLLFLTVDYTLLPAWLTVRLGRFKRPFSRSFATMASQLSMIDRPLTVGPGAFGDDVDTGLMVHNGVTGPLEYALALFTGGASLEQARPLVVARVGYATEGLSGYSESDLEGGAPRFGVALAGLADLDAGGEPGARLSGVLDLVLKAHGFSLTSAFYVGAHRGGPGGPEPRLSAIGHHTQLGYVIAGLVEPVVRYALFMPVGESDDIHDLAGGLNLYFHGHALKLQTFASMRLREGQSAPEVRLQSQLSLAL